VSAPTIEAQAAHCLDEVIVTLSELSAKTKPEHEKVRADLARCIETCEHIQGEFGKYVALAAGLDRALSKPRPGREALKAALGVEGEATNDDLCAAAATVIRYAADAAPQEAAQ